MASASTESLYPGDSAVQPAPISKPGPSIHWWIICLLTLSLLPALLPRITHPVPALKLDDFDVYYTASTLVRLNESPHIYDGADTGRDPQLAYADNSSIYATTGQKLGVPIRQAGAPSMQLYVYPPTLADLLVPVTLINLGKAEKLWVVISYAACILSCLAIVRLLDLPLISFGSFGILVAALIAQPTLNCIAWGQIGLVLMFLWVSAILCYHKGYDRASAVLLGLATAIKLTPLIAIVPVLIWKDWKWMKAYAGTLVGIGLAVLLINHPATSLDFIQHVMPAMSHGIMNRDNATVGSVLQIFWVVAHHGLVFPASLTAPGSIVALGKLLSLVCLADAGVAVYRTPKLEDADRILVLAMFAMLSAPLAPVSWWHAYAVGLIGLALLWAEVLKAGGPLSRIIVLLVNTLMTTSYLVHIMSHELNTRHAYVVMALVALIVPATTIWLALDRLLRLKQEPAHF